MEIEKNKVKDKIFNNTFGDREFEGGTLSFNVDSLHESTLSTDDEVHLKILFDEIDALIKDSEFKDLNKLNEKGNVVKLNKVQINKVYNYITLNLSKRISRIEIWSILSDYFDIYPNKFYSSLSNSFKHELVLELDNKLGILDKKGIKTIF